MVGLLYLLGYGSSRSLPFCHGTDITASETEPNDNHLSMELFFWVGLVADSVRRLYQFHLSQNETTSTSSSTQSIFSYPWKLHHIVDTNTRLREYQFASVG